MERLDQKPMAHLFICCRSREGEKACCAEKGSVEMVKELKSWAKTCGLTDQIKVSQSSCLGHCENGIAACLYPENQWFSDLNKDNLAEIKQKLKERAK